MATVAKKGRLPMTTPAPAPPPQRTAWESIKSHPRAAALVVGAVVAGVAIALLLGKGSHSRRGTTQVSVTPIGPTLVSASGLKTLAHDLGQVIYWVGPVAGDKYEVTRSSTNDVYLRYLPRGVKAGAHQGKYLLIATYPLAGALSSLVASDSGELLTVAGGKGGLAAVDRGHPTNVRVAFPHVDYEIEVYAPHAPKKARVLATSGAITRAR
jgi:hypothetical protein